MVFGAGAATVVVGVTVVAAVVVVLGVADEVVLVVEVVDDDGEEPPLPLLPVVQTLAVGTIVTVSLIPDPAESERTEDESPHSKFAVALFFL